MNVNITTFTNPFSFFCQIKNDGECLKVLETNDDQNNYRYRKSEISDFYHGQVSYKQQKNIVYCHKSAIGN